MMFSEMPHEQRDRIRKIVEDNNGYCASYEGGHLTVAMPNIGVNITAIHDGMCLENMFKIDSCYFPIGSDNPPNCLRHNAGYSGRPGFWHYIKFNYEG